MGMSTKKQATKPQTKSVKPVAKAQQKVDVKVVSKTDVKAAAPKIVAKKPELKAVPKVDA